MSARYVVTGASGFIGRRLCEALRERGPVTAVLRHAQTGPWDHIITADLERDEIPARAFDGAHAVFHLAGRAHAVTERSSDIGLYMQVNVNGTRRVLNAARASGVPRFVLASSVKAIGEDGDADGPQVCAMVPNVNFSAYGISKQQAELEVWTSGIPAAAVLRLSLVYGPGVEGNLGGMLRAVKSGRFPPPPRVANRRSMVHVDDVVRVAIAAAHHDGATGKTFVVGDGVRYSTRGIYDAMVRALGRDAPSWSLPAPCWRSLAIAGDVLGAIRRRRAPFDTEAYRKLFGSAWYEPADLVSALGVPRFLTLEDALPSMVRAL